MRWTSWRLFSEACGALWRALAGAQSAAHTQDKGFANGGTNKALCQWFHSVVVCHTLPLPLWSVTWATVHTQEWGEERAACGGYNYGPSHGPAWGFYNCGPSHGPQCYTPETHRSHRVCQRGPTNAVSPVSGRVDVLQDCLIKCTLPDKEYVIEYTHTHAKPRLAAKIGDFGANPAA